MGTSRMLRMKRGTKLTFLRFLILLGLLLISLSIFVPLRFISLLLWCVFFGFAFMNRRNASLTPVQLWKRFS